MSNPASPTSPPTIEGPRAQVITDYTGGKKTYRFQVYARVPLADVTATQVLSDRLAARDLPGSLEVLNQDDGSESADKLERMLTTALARPPQPVGGMHILGSGGVADLKVTADYGFETPQCTFELHTEVFLDEAAGADAARDLQAALANNDADAVLDILNRTGTINDSVNLESMVRAAVSD